MNQIEKGGTPVVMLTTFHRPQPFFFIPLSTPEKKGLGIFLVHKIESNKIVLGGKRWAEQWSMTVTYILTSPPLSFSSNSCITTA
jgi:hypothetical protein